jgi:hypothetical protein
VEGQHVLRVLILLLTVILVATGCGDSNSNATPEPTPDPDELLMEAAQNIRNVDSFRLLLEQKGADYPFAVNVANLPGTAVLLRADAQYVAPDELFATVKLSLAGLPFSLDVFAQDGNQWLRLPASPWASGNFAPGFNPAVLIAEDSGFHRALSSLMELKFMGNDTLIDGTKVFHLTGVANGAMVKDLLVGLIDVTNDVLVDVFIDRETRFPALVVVTQPGTATEDQPDTSWRVEVYDVNAAPDFATPQAGQ